MRNWRTMILLLGFSALLGTVTTAQGHQASIAVLSLKEIQPGSFILRWLVAPSIDTETLQPRFPEHCTLNMPRLDCGEQGLNGPVSFDGLGTKHSASVIRVTWQNGDSRSYTLTAAQPSVTVAAEPDHWTGVATAYTALGFDHILLGVDHLLFVLGLIWIVASPWMLAKTITAFTIAHSITLAAATLGWVGVPERAVNAAIALSIVFVGVEIIKVQRGEQNLTARYPWLVAFAFGLLHGFGFANALTELGLPEESIPLALLFFNVGVELGQLAFVFLVLILQWSYRRMDVHWPRWSQPVPAYAIGPIAMYWFYQRMAIILVA